MNTIANNDFNLEDLILVKYHNDYIDYLDSKTKKQLKNVTFYPNTYYFMEKITSNDNSLYREYYTDVLYAIDIFERESNEEFKSDPDFLEILPFPRQYLTYEELAKGTVTRWRLFTIFQQVNSNYRIKEKTDYVKKLY